MDETTQVDSIMMMIPNKNPSSSKKTKISHYAVRTNLQIEEVADTGRSYQRLDMVGMKDSAEVLIIAAQQVLNTKINTDWSLQHQTGCPRNNPATNKPTHWSIILMFTCSLACLE